MIRKTNINSEGWRDASQGEKFHRAALSLGSPKDDSLIGCTAYSVKPGKRAFPKHGHLVNDEAIYVISGLGSLNVGDETESVVAGDYAWLPRGSKNAHVLINDGDDDLVYLCMSTNIWPAVVHYPDSGKIGAYGRNDDSIAFLAPLSAKVDYFDGEVSRDSS